MARYKFADTISIHLRTPRALVKTCEKLARTHGVSRTQVMLNAIQNQLGLAPHRGENIFEGGNDGRDPK